MTGKEAIRYAMSEKRMTQQQTAEKAGYTRQSNVAEVLRSDNARVDSMIRILNACGYDVVMIDQADRSKQFVLEPVVFDLKKQG